MRHIQLTLLMILLVVSHSLHSQGGAGAVIKGLRAIFSSKSSVSSASKSTLKYAVPVYEYSRMLPKSEIERLRRDADYGSWYTDLERRLEESLNKGDNEYWDGFNRPSNPYHKSLEDILGEEYLRSPIARERYNTIELPEKTPEEKALEIKASDKFFYLLRSNLNESLDLDLVAIQRILKKKGFGITVDGRYGPNTKQAICKVLKVNADEAYARNVLELAKVKLLKGSTQNFQIVDNYVDLLKANAFAVMIAHGSVKDVKELQAIEKFYEGFFSKIGSVDKDDFANTLFYSFLKHGNHEYVGVLRKGQNKVNCFLYKFDMNAKGKNALFKKGFIGKNQSVLSQYANGTVYLYGDHLPKFSDNLLDKADDHNITVISRNTSISRSFKETEVVLDKLKEKKLDAATTTFFNGTPQTSDEAMFQSFKATDVDLLQRLKTDIDKGASTKVSNVLNNVEEFKRELLEGDNDILLIVAHSDKESLYFGAEKISIDDLALLPKRTDRKKERIAVLLSCNTGDIFANPKLPVTKSFKTFPEVLLEKNFIDLAVVPSSTLNGNEVLLLIEELHKHNVLSLHHHFNELIESGKMRGVAHRQ